ncbi:MAG: DUF1080 domain-containing protein [Roseibacillus sp.]|tara:strand:- start:145 stop:753 length:609 start_codon:yes stop_codon:yes gene_type:complete
MRIFATLSLLLLAPMTASAEPAWQDLFNGRNLDGWHPVPGGKWEVVEGTILGTSPRSEPRHGLLMTDRRFKNFRVRAKFKVTSGDSGFYFRVEKTNTHVSVRGFQAEVDNSKEVGGLYETSMRAWVRKPDPTVISKLVKPGAWTDLLVSAIGDSITVSLNGTKVTELLNDPKCLKEGHIALQLHGGQDMRVQFKDIAIQELP